MRVLFGRVRTFRATKSVAKCFTGDLAEEKIANRPFQLHANFKPRYCDPSSKCRWNAFQLVTCTAFHVIAMQELGWIYRHA